MKVSKLFLGILALCAMPLAAQTSQNALDQVVDKIVMTENAEIQKLHTYSPLVETYSQQMRPDDALGTVPNGDRYFLGRAELGKGVQLESLTENGQGGFKQKVLGGFGNVFSLQMEFLPRGFLQMIYVDNDGFNKQNYKFDYVRARIPRRSPLHWFSTSPPRLMPARDAFSAAFGSRTRRLPRRPF